MRQKGTPNLMVIKQHTQLNDHQKLGLEDINGCKSKGPEKGNKVESRLEAHHVHHQHIISKVMR